MGTVQVLAFALFMVVQAASQDASKTFPYPVLQEWKSNPFALSIGDQAGSQDAFQMLPYSVPRDGPSSPTVQAQYKFSDGKTIIVDYSTRHVIFDSPQYGSRFRPRFGEGWQTVFNDIKFVTDEGLITVNGTSVPAGDYTIAVSNQFPRVFLELIMKRHQGGESRVPLSATKLASPAENSAISFEYTGGGCMMHVNSKNWNTQLSVEFREKNSDLPIKN